VKSFYEHPAVLCMYFCGDNHSGLEQENDKKMLTKFLKDAFITCFVSIKTYRKISFL
jgi:hypothetical protein